MKAYIDQWNSQLIPCEITGHLDDKTYIVRITLKHARAGYRPGEITNHAAAYVVSRKTRVKDGFIRVSPLCDRSGHALYGPFFNR